MTEPLIYGLRVQCPDCAGSGAIVHTLTRKCGRCGGSGQLRSERVIYEQPSQTTDAHDAVTLADEVF